MWRLTSDCVDLVLAWWKRDRIRVRPSEGRLFRLRPGTVLCFSGSPDSLPATAEVVARSEGRDPRRPGVCYSCSASQGDGELIVTRDGEGVARIQWLAGGRSRELLADDIEVFSA